MEIQHVIVSFIPIVIFMIPIVAILASHQQKMAKIIHQGGDANQASEMAAVRQELAQLRDQVARLTLALDNSMRRPIDAPSVSQRIGEN